MRVYSVKLVTSGGCAARPDGRIVPGTGPLSAKPMNAAVELLTPAIGFTAEGKEQAEAGRSIILLEEKKVPFGITVDSVVKMTKLEEPTPAFGKTQDIDQKYVKGMAYEDDQEILILDFERLLHAG